MRPTPTLAQELYFYALRPKYQFKNEASLLYGPAEFVTKRWWVQLRLAFNLNEQNREIQRLI